MKNYSEYHIEDPLFDKEYGLAFIDNSPGLSRTSCIYKLKDKAGMILAHDAQEKGYRYDEILHLFKYKYFFKDFSTCTWVLSNYSDVSKIEWEKHQVYDWSERINEIQQYL